MAFLELTYPGGHRTKTSLRGFEIYTDYPRYLGGDESAPAPWHLFLASLASCQGIHIRNYCAENNLNYAGIKLTVDPVASANDPDRFTDFNIEVFLPEGFPDGHVEAMLNAAKACRVVKHLCVYPVQVNLKIKTL